MHLSIQVFHIAGRRKSTMRVDTKDGSCRSCGGELVIVDADDASMQVECMECQDSYLVEPDAFADGSMTYYVPFLADQAFEDETSILRQQMEEIHGSTDCMG